MPKAFRLALLAYPRAYRRERGREIVDTVRDAGLTRSPRALANLVRFGMRCRLGYPASRSIVFWAIAVCVVCGLFAASLAVRLAWETARPMPTEAQARQIIGELLPGHAIGGGDDTRVPPTFQVFGQPLGVEHVDDLLFGDGNEYELNWVGVARHGNPPIDQEQTLATALQRLHDGGWKIDGPYVADAVVCGGPPCDPANVPKTTTVFGTRGDDVVEIGLTTGIDYFLPSTYLTASVTRATPALALPAGIAGGLIGFLFSWLLFGWISRRTAARWWTRTGALAIFTLTMLLWALPILLFAPLALVMHLGAAPRARWEPIWVWLGQPFSLLPLVAGCVLSLAAVALACLPRPSAAQPHIQDA